MLTSKCTFCQIVSREIPSQRVAEHRDWVAFLDIEPVNKGHTLVVPRRHYPTLLDMPGAELNGVLELIQRIATVLRDEFGYRGFNIHQSNGRVAGQDVEHVHFQIWPRLSNDQVRVLLPIGAEYEQGEMKETAQRMLNALSGLSSQ